MLHKLVGLHLPRTSRTEVTASAGGKDEAQGYRRCGLAAYSRCGSVFPAGQPSCGKPYYLFQSTSSAAAVSALSEVTCWPANQSSPLHVCQCIVSLLLEVWHVLKNACMSLPHSEQQPNIT